MPLIKFVPYLALALFAFFAFQRQFQAAIGCMIAFAILITMTDKMKGKDE